MIPLWENEIPYFNDAYGQQPPALDPHIVEGSKACVIVIPGGGYEWIANDHEGIAIANALNENGISALILRYRIKPYMHPVMQCDVNRAVRVARSLAGQYGYDEDKIAVLGFSAGGHLAVTALTHFDYGKKDGDEIDRISCRPDMGILCYAVIQIHDKYTHTGTSVNLLGSEPDRALADSMSGEKAVREDCPPCFIWHTFADCCVPCENALLFAKALSDKKIPYELHIFPEGPHGIGLGGEWKHSAQWFPLLVNYIKDHWKL